MDTLIRSARVLKEPVLLSTKLKRGEPAAQAPETTLDSAPFMPHAGLDQDKSKNPSVEEGIEDNLHEVNYTEKTYPLAYDMKEQERELLRQKEIEAEKQKAAELGYAEGYSAGTAASEGEYSERLAALQALINSTAEALKEDIAGLEDTVLEIVFAAVTKILGKTIVEGEGVTAIVREVISHAKNRERLVIRVSPKDFAVLDQNRAGLLTGIEDGKVELVADDRVQLGGCLLETAGGNLDGRLEVQMQQLRDTLISARTTTEVSA